ncbi:MAG TPA: glutaredoxin family protein [Gammaproteobacteria bacterium]|nr:glutaredoxin family protein [Gammaproteobacteria bacterium]
MALPLILYYRNDCHLCDEMLAELRILYGDRLQMSLVDVDTDAALQARFGLQVPVLTDGTKILSLGKLDRSSLEEYLGRHTNPGL